MYFMIPNKFDDFIDGFSPHAGMIAFHKHNESYGIIVNSI